MINILKFLFNFGLVLFLINSYLIAIREVVNAKTYPRMIFDFCIGLFVCWVFSVTKGMIIK